MYNQIWVPGLRGSSGNPDYQTAFPAFLARQIAVIAGAYYGGHTHIGTGKNINTLVFMERSEAVPQR